MTPEQLSSILMDSVYDAAQEKACKFFACEYHELDYAEREYEAQRSYELDGPYIKDRDFLRALARRLRPYLKAD
jgi:hypothetical protein